MASAAQKIRQYVELSETAQLAGDLDLAVTYYRIAYRWAASAAKAGDGIGSIEFKPETMKDALASLEEERNEQISDNQGGIGQIPVTFLPTKTNDQCGGSW